MKLFLLIALIFVAGCTSTGQVASTPVVAEVGDHVAVDYTGTLSDGSVFDTSEGRAPLEFDVGAGQMIQGFDQAVLGMAVDEEKTVTISPEEAYGQPIPDLVVEIPIENVPAGIQVGDTLSAGGQRVRVVEIKDDVVVIDANHFLSGQTLTFKITMVRIEKG